MGTFYQILGITSTATEAEIKMAYKQLAKQYHPDYNPGDLQAEENFKKINEAYQTLSNPIKRAKYDLQTFYTVQWEAEPVPAYSRRPHPRWERWQQTKQEQTFYKIDQSYIKTQLLSFLIFMVIAGFCIVIMHAITFFVHQRELAKWRAYSEEIQHINQLFNQDKISESFARAKTLRESNPIDMRILTIQDSMIAVLSARAQAHYDNHEFAPAIYYYRLIETYETSASLAPTLKIAECQIALGNTAEAKLLLENLLHQNPTDVHIPYTLGLLFLEKENNPTMAAHYLDLAKDIFKQDFSNRFGKAFMITLKAENIADFYYDLFVARAKTNLQLQRYEEVLNDCNWGTYLRPNAAEIYRLRAMANLSLFDYKNVCADLARAAQLNDEEAKMLSLKHCVSR
jgi:DnaJ-domain-containing protein 1